MQTSPASAFETPGSAVVSSQSVTSTPVQTGPPSRPELNVAYNPTTKELNISSLSYQLRCPNGLKITWLPQSVGSTTTQVLSSRNAPHVCAAKGYGYKFPHILVLLQSNAARRSPAMSPCIMMTLL